MFCAVVVVVFAGLSDIGIGCSSVATSRCAPLSCSSVALVGSKGLNDFTWLAAADQMHGVLALWTAKPAAIPCGRRHADN